MDELSELPVKLFRSGVRGTSLIDALTSCYLHAKPQSWDSSLESFSAPERDTICGILSPSVGSSLNSVYFPLSPKVYSDMVASFKHSD